MKLSPKQDYVRQLVKEKRKKVIVLEGPIGTSKTYASAVIMISLALKYPGSVIYVGRKNRPEMRKGTLLSFREAAFDMQLVESYHYKEYNQELYWKFLRAGQGSYIFFVELDHTKDPTFFKIKGANITAAFIDEADGVVQEGFNMLHSRTGRANKNGAPDFTLLAMNANEAWTKDEYHNKYQDPEQYGKLPADVEVVEFELEDSFLPDDYYLKQLNNPKQWVERYIKNNWAFGDDLYSLFKYRHMDSVHVGEFERTSNKVLTIDAARIRDRTVGAHWDNNTLVDIQIFKDKDVEMDYDEQAKLIHDYAEAEGIGWQNIWVDAVGEGQGLIASLKLLYGWQVNSFVSNASPVSKQEQDKQLSEASDRYQKERIKQAKPITYKDLRSEQTYLFSYDVERGNVHFYDGCPHLALFKKEATMHNYEIKNNVFKVESKQKVKERTMYSPDIFDAVMMGYYAQRKLRSFGSYSSRRATQVRTNRKRPRTAGWRSTSF